MSTVVLIIVAILLGLVIVGVFWNRVRSSANFSLVYIRALRIEGSKELAIAAALEHLRTFVFVYRVAPALKSELCNNRLDKSHKFGYGGMDECEQRVQRSR
ncbi:MAG: hypothetical protein ACR2L2_17610, partial [Acidobacteriota bacterium]